MPANFAPGPLGQDSTESRGRIDRGTLARVATPQPTQLAANAPPPQVKPTAVNPPHVTKFFDALYDVLKKLADELGINEDYILALSSYESGWSNPHNSGLCNPFGLTKAGGNNLAYASPKAAADYWKTQFGPQVRGVTSIKSFTDGLLGKPHVYNSVNPKWASNVQAQYATIVKRKPIWLAQRVKKKT